MNFSRLSIASVDHKQHLTEVDRQLSKLGKQKKLQHPRRPAEDTVRTTKGLQERTQIIEWDDGEA